MAVQEEAEGAASSVTVNDGKRRGPPEMVVPSHAGPPVMERSESKTWWYPAMKR